MTCWARPAGGPGRGWASPALVEGGLADLVVYRDDPRADPVALRHPELVLLRGRPYRV